MAEKITIQAHVNAPMATVWTCWTEPEHVTQWNNASPDWHTPSASNDLRVGGTFLYRMEAKDGSFGFDFGGTYMVVDTKKRIVYVMGDGREVDNQFSEGTDGVDITIIFDAETQNPIDMQRAGWQSILDNFKKYTESN
ncbi:MAG: SRPBCC family protein [Chitinophagales bacterium]